MRKRIIVDTGYWFALFNPADKRHKIAEGQFQLLENGRILIPWPSLYECINSLFLKKTSRAEIKRFEQILRSNPDDLINDGAYRDNALTMALQKFDREGRTISLVDNVNRLMIDDSNLKVHCLLTFDPSDFIDVCRKNKVEMI